VLSFHRQYRQAFAVLLVPALLTLFLLLVARWRYPKLEEFGPKSPPRIETKGFRRSFWLYLAGAALVAAGFADFTLIAHREKLRLPRAFLCFNEHA